MKALDRIAEIEADLDAEDLTMSSIKESIAVNYVPMLCEIARIAIETLDKIASDGVFKRCNCGMTAAEAIYRINQEGES